MVDTSFVLYGKGGKDMLTVTAKDSNGNKFTKTVRLKPIAGRLAVDFGGHCCYYYENLLKYYPYKKPFCIDMGGRNHMGYSQVDISPEEMDKIIEYVQLNVPNTDFTIEGKNEKNP